MNHELAKTLTTALVQFIDEQRPEGSMCCSNGECESIEQILEGEHFDIVETFIQKKLSKLTEFETHLKWLIENGGSGIEHVKVGANELLALAKKELFKQGEGTYYYSPNNDELTYIDSMPIRMPYAVPEMHTLRPLCYEPGGTCTNPHFDCINCPKKTTGGIFTSPNTISGTSAATMHGNTSATDGKEHNPSFTD